MVYQTGFRDSFSNKNCRDNKIDEKGDQLDEVGAA